MTPALPSRVAVVLCALTASACFEVTKVPLPPLTIDDFEDGDDNRPKSDFFDPWTCRTFISAGDDGGAGDDPDGGVVPAAAVCTVGIVGSQPRAMTLRFALDDPPDGQRQLGGAEIATRASRTSVDFGSFQQLLFGAILDSADPAFPDGTQLRVEIGCPVGGMPRTMEQIVAGLVINKDWATFRLDLANFTPLVPGCLRQVDALRISVRPGLPDGVSTSGALRLDNIQLQ